MAASVSIEQLVALNDEIIGLVRGGVPLELGLAELGTDSAGALQQITQALVARMQAGASLSEALAAEQQRLPAAYRTIVDAGLRTGRLPSALESLSRYARELVDLRRRITLALVYPFLVVVLAYFLFAVFIVDLVERLRETYEMFRIPMHWSLQAVLATAHFVSRWWWAPPLVLVGIVIWWIMTGGANLLSFRGAARPLAEIPYVGRISRLFQLASFAELLALMIEHDVPLPEGLRLAADASGDPRLCRAGWNLAETVEQGTQPARDQARRFDFPPFLFWVLTCGQQQAGLTRLLRHAGAIYRRQADHLSHSFKVIFPIVAAVVIGGGVTVLYTLTLFGPLAQFWSDLGGE